jgi:hypothetical protein
VNRLTYLSPASTINVKHEQLRYHHSHHNASLQFYTVFAASVAASLYRQLNGDSWRRNVGASCIRNADAWREVHAVATDEQPKGLVYKPH